MYSAYVGVGYLVNPHSVSFLRVPVPTRNIKIIIVLVKEACLSSPLFHSVSPMSAPLSSFRVSSNLAGIRVLDLSRVLAGPYCTMLLGDQGAEVIKIERPVGGDDTRGWGPPFTKAGNESAYFLSTNRNKKSFALDLKAEEGKEIIKALVSKSHVLVENFLPGTMEKLGLGYESLSPLNPGLVYCSISGYGQTGPLKDRPGYAVMMEAHAGMMSATGPQVGDPVKCGVAWTDIITGLHAHGGILAALYSGKGQRVDCSLLESQVSALANIGSNFLIGGEEASRRGSDHASIVPYRTFRCANQKHVACGAGNDAQFIRFARAVGRPELAELEKFKTNQGRVKHRDVLIPLLDEAFLEKSSYEWEQIFMDAELPFAQVNSMSEVFADPQTLARGMKMELTHPSAGPISLPGAPVKFSGEHGGGHMPPPMLGEHSRYVLKDILSFSEDRIRKLELEKVVSGVF